MSATVDIKESIMVDIKVERNDRKTVTVIVGARIGNDVVPLAVVEYDKETKKVIKAEELSGLPLKI